MSTFQQVIIIGRVGSDLESKSLNKKDNKTGSVVNFSIATTEGTKEKPLTEWHNITAWDKLAEICDKLLKKGSLIQVVGKLKTDTYEKDNVKHYNTVIVINEMSLLADGKEKE